MFVDTLGKAEEAAVCDGQEKRDGVQNISSEVGEDDQTAKGRTGTLDLQLWYSGEWKIFYIFW